VQPVVDKRMIEIPIENSQPIDLNEKGRKARGRAKVKRPPKKFHMPDGVRTGFTKASRMDATSDDESDEEPAPKKKKATAKKKTAPAKSRRQPAETEPEPVQLPFLDDVLLNGVQQKELERKYAHAAEEEADLVIQAPNPNRYPDTLKNPGGTKYIRHSRGFGVVQRTMNALGDINQEKLKWLESDDGIKDFLTDAGPARMRLVSPEADIGGSEIDLPGDSRPVSKAKSKTAAKAPARKKQPVQGKPLARSPRVVDGNGPTNLPAVKNPRGRPPKKTIQRAKSYGLAAAEGNESSPEPTPANMRIGTQGIDLGTMDTSGEDEDEESDSELDEFIVRSDQPIEIASSSQRLPDDTQPPRPAKARTKGLKNAAAKSRAIMSDSGSDESDVGLAALCPRSGDESSEVEEVNRPADTAPAPVQPVVRKRRIVDESDSDD
jgi:ATP-dependent DNA helicase MPH1